MTEIETETETEVLLRRRLRELARCATADMAPATVTSITPADPLSELGSLTPLQVTGRRRQLRRPLALAVALSAAAAALVGMVALTGNGSGSTNRTVTADVPTSAADTDLGASPPYLALSGRWTVTAVNADGSDTGWREFTDVSYSSSFGFVAGYAYGAACVPWVSNGLSAPSPTSPCPYPAPTPDPVTGAVITPFMVRAALEHPAEVTHDADTLTIISRADDGSWALGLRARRDGDAEPQRVPTAWLTGTTWGLSAAGDIRPEAGEDLGWVQVAEIAGDGTTHPDTFVGLVDVTPPCTDAIGVGVATMPVRCLQDERHQQAFTTAVRLWNAAAEVVTLTAEGLVLSTPDGELRARLLLADPSTAAPTAGPIPTAAPGPTTAPEYLATATTVQAGAVPSVITADVAAGTSAPGPTKGTVPAGLSDPSAMPDYISVSDQTGAIVGYAPRDELFAPPRFSTPEQAASFVSPPVPVYADDLVTLVGHMYPAKGFIPLGVDPNSVPAGPVTTTSG